MNKTFSENEAAAWAKQQRDAGLRVGFTCGAFDLLHAGHVAYLQRARSLCDRLMVAVNSDDSIKGYKSSLRPIVSQSQRMAVVAGLAAVDAVTLLTDSRPASIIERIRPDLYIKGGDYSVDKLRSRTIVEAYGGEAVVIPVEFDVSSSTIIERAAAVSCHDLPELVPTPSVNRIAFLDRDGTIIRNIPFLHEPARVELMPDAGWALSRLQRLGFRLAIVTNQQGIGLGYYGIDELVATNQSLFRTLAPFGVKIWRVYFCPHSLADDCGCRKPKPGLLTKALRHTGANPKNCCLIGDSRSDVAAGESVGIPSFLAPSDRFGSISEVVDAIEEISRSESRPSDQSRSGGLHGPDRSSNSLVHSPSNSGT